jgi:hypothetical protein
MNFKPGLEDFTQHELHLAALALLVVHATVDRSGGEFEVEYRDVDVCNRTALASWQPVPRAPQHQQNPTTRDSDL